MNPGKWPFPILFFMFAAAALAGCARTQPSRFYVLTAIPEAENPASSQFTRNGKTIGVGPVEIPSYLDRPQIVIRTGPHEIELAEFDKWAGTLKENATTVLAENLSTLLATDQVYVFPWRTGISIRYQVTIQVLRFDAVPGEGVALDAHWVILGDDGRRMLLMRGSRVRQPVSGTEYNDIVAAESLALGELSRDIAAALQTLSE